MVDRKIQIIKDDDIDLKALIRVFWLGRNKIIKVTIFIAFISVIYSLMITPLYKSTITMFHANNDSKSNLSQLKGMASNFGLDVGGNETSINILDIVRSRRIKKDLIYQKWNTKKYEKPVNLIQYWEIDNSYKISFNPLYWIKFIFLNTKNENDPSLKWEEIALKELNKRLKVKEDKVTGLISVEILMEEAVFASEIVNSIFPAIVDFKNNTQTHQVKLNRQFIEKRKDQVNIELRSAEENLKDFRQRNRNVSESPELQLELERLIRQVEIQTQVYITLQQQYELARIEEVNETPSLIVLDSGFPAVAKHKPNRKLIVLSLSFIGFIAVSIFVIIKSQFKN